MGGGHNNKLKKYINTAILHHECREGGVTFLIIISAGKTTSGKKRTSWETIVIYYEDANFLSATLKGINHWRNLQADRRIILKLS
jgi:hypothetical protein